MIKVGWLVDGLVIFTFISTWWVLLRDGRPDLAPLRLKYLGFNVFGVIAYFIVDKCIPIFMKFNEKAGLSGKDLNKKGTPQGDVPVPESLGLVPATVFVLVSILGFILISDEGFKYQARDTAALLSICLIILLGFVDDVIDLPWRYKLIIPPIASIPLLVTYSGSTIILLPKLVRPFLGKTLDLGFLYYIYMGMLSVFCSNSINIYAGINGLEVGQSIIIGLSVIVHNIIELWIGADEITVTLHFFSLTIITIYLAVILCLFKYNKYPSKVFVGDTFCYFSGMVLAVVGILGHFSKTLLLFFIPQVLNFLISVPQLFKFIPCPRHRLPKYNQETKQLECVKNHLTLINAFLFVKGPTSEENTCTYLLLFQVACCGFGFFVRYGLGSYFF